MNDPESNKMVVQQYVQAFNRGDMDGLRSLFAPDALIWGVLGFGSVDDAMPIWRELCSGISMRLSVEGIIGEGDTVAVRFRETGTFKGPFRGKEPTGKSYDIVAMEWFVLRDGKIVRRWGARDSASISRQIGM
jgi:ketosteroid isomerase-like protein